LAFYPYAIRLFEDHNTTILVLNTYDYRDPEGPILLDLSVEIMTELTNFVYESGTGVEETCSFVQNGIMFIIGGTGDYIRQISIVESCQLRNVGTLPYDFHDGACNNFRNSIGDEEAMLCFAQTSMNGCLV